MHHKKYHCINWINNQVKIVYYKIYKLISKEQFQGICKNHDRFSEYIYTEREYFFESVYFFVN